MTLRAFVNDDARCRDRDADTWFPDGESDRRSDPARRVCLTCPVRDDCLAFAMEAKVRYGIWGGMTSSQRERIRRGHTTADREWGRWHARKEAERRPRPRRPSDYTTTTKPTAEQDAVAAEAILADVADNWDVGPDEVLSRSQNRRVNSARHEAMARIYHETGMTGPQIAAMFDRDHSTVSYAVRKQEVPA